MMSACLFVDIPDFLITKLQCVQNAVARIVLNLKKYDLSDEPALATCTRVHYLQTEPHCVQGIKG